MTDAFVRLAETGDAFNLAADMREHDQRECRAFGVEPIQALLTPLKLKRDVFSITDPSGTIYAMYGISHGHDFGIPWMLTSNAFPRIAKPFAQKSKLYFNALASSHHYLENLVSVENKVAHRWLTHLGFNLEHGHARDFGGIAFIPFWKYNV